MPRAERQRTIAAPRQAVWEVIADPHHMPRWWPGVERMEGVEGNRFTQVFSTRRGRRVRVDFRVVQSEEPSVRAWAQEIEGTPFARVLGESVVEVRLEPDGDAPDATRVTLSQDQKLRGYSRTGTFMLRRATRDKLGEALDGLERILG